MESQKIEMNRCIVPVRDSAKLAMNSDPKHKLGRKYKISQTVQKLSTYLHSDRTF